MEWEYLIYEEWVDNTRLNKLGKLGWELVCVSGASYIFKRPAPRQRSLFDENLDRAGMAT